MQKAIKIFQIVKFQKEVLVKMRTVLILHGILVFVVGCASFNAPIERWVGGNTFHSEKFPTVNVKVSDELPFISHKQEEGTQAAGAFVEPCPEKIKFDTYFFDNEEGGKSFLVIQIGFTLAGDCFFSSPDYSKQKDVLKHSDEKLLGTRYSTGIFPLILPDGTVGLFKKWGRAAGNSTFFTITYFEQMDQAWADVNILTAKQERTLQEFDERATKSFEVIP